MARRLRVRGLDALAVLAVLLVVLLSLPALVLWPLLLVCGAIGAGMFPQLSGGLQRYLRGKRAVAALSEHNGMVWVHFSLEFARRNPDSEDTNEAQEQVQEQAREEDPRYYSGFKPARQRYMEFSEGDFGATQLCGAGSYVAADEMVEMVEAEEKAEKAKRGLNSSRADSFFTAKLLPKQWYYSHEDYDVPSDDDMRKFAKVASRQHDALHIAAFFGWTDAVACLLDAGFDCNMPHSTGRDLNQLLSEISHLRSYAAVTPLQLAEEQGHAEVVELLQARGAQKRTTNSSFVAEAAIHIRHMIRQGQVGLHTKKRTLSCAIPYLSHDVLESTPYQHEQYAGEFEPGQWIKRGNEISRGHFGVVYEAELHPKMWIQAANGSRHPTPPFPVCIKEVSIPVDAQKRQLFWNELGMQMLSFTRQQCRLQNPLYVGYSISGDKLWILMRRRELTLRTFALSHPKDRVPIVFLRQIAFDLADQLYFCFHVREVVHGDIKPDNVLLSANNSQVLSIPPSNPGALMAEFTDYGLARACNGEHVESQPHIFYQRTCAPEISETHTATMQSDIYAFGILLLDCLLGESARCGRTMSVEDGLAKVYEEYLDERSEQKEQECVATLIEVTRRCMSDDPAERPTAQEIQATMKEVGATVRNPSEFAAGLVFYCSPGFGRLANAMPVSAVSIPARRAEAKGGSEVPFRSVRVNGPQFKNASHEPRVLRPMPSSEQKGGSAGTTTSLPRVRF